MYVQYHGDVLTTIDYMSLQAKHHNAINCKSSHCNPFL